MRNEVAFAVLLVIGVAGCTTPPQPQPRAVEQLGVTLVSPAVDVVPHRPDAAAYLPLPEQVWGFDSGAGKYAFVRVQMGKVVKPIAPSPTPQPTVAAVRDLARPVKLLIVHFDFDKAVLSPVARSDIDGFLPLIVGANGLIRVDGFTDSIGTHNYNQKLSFMRAEAVRAYLLKKGLPAESLAVSGHADADPADTNATEQGRADNRRAVVHVLEK